MSNSEGKYGKGPFPVASSAETTPPVLGINSIWLRPKACIGILVCNFYANCIEVQRRTAEYRITNIELRRQLQEGLTSSFEIPCSIFHIRVLCFLVAAKGLHWERRFRNSAVVSVPVIGYLEFMFDAFVKICPGRHSREGGSPDGLRKTGFPPSRE